MARVYTFDDECDDKDVLGNKGANLVKMTRLGLPVPPGFVVPVEAFKEYVKTGSLPEPEIKRGLDYLARKTGKDLGKGLQVSVRSAAAVSMPGMMDTVLNIGDEDAMRAALVKVFDSWNNNRAIEYRKMHQIPEDLGTAAVVQAMVFGNADERSGTGVVFSRNANTGDRGLFGEYLPRAQGEELVSGATTPLGIEELEKRMPGVYDELSQMAKKLEAHFKEMQDIEFTVESGKLYMLQTRTGKRSGRAAVKIAVDMAKSGVISIRDALLRVTPDDLRGLLHNNIACPQDHVPAGRGMGAAPGAATGRVVFYPPDAVIWAKKDEPVILVRPETSPDDVPGIAAATGVLTSRGGLTSHAAIVTRALGKPCICGAEDVEIDLATQKFTINGHLVSQGDVITIDGSTGNIYLGALPMTLAEMTPELDELLGWADRVKRLGVRANADSAENMALARKFGAESIGLCRTERQFKDPERLAMIREFILAATDQERSAAIAKLRSLQKADFAEIFAALNGTPVIIRLLDLPLHEFLPAEGPGIDERTRQRILELREVNPMMGHRGVRLGITNPEVYHMQIDAICEARAEVAADVSIMVPQVITLQELVWVKRYLGERDVKLGVMMETVRACMRAGPLAEVADFLSFGTNDLTQAVLSFSREDAEKKFLTTYLEIDILKDNPFEILDVKGVGRLMQTAIEWARRCKPDIEIGVCGEHGGEPRSIAFFHAIGVDYVSCSPFRVPVARLAAARAALERRGSDAIYKGAEVVA